MRASALFLLLVTAVATACGDGRPNPVREAMAATPMAAGEQAVALRFPASRNAPARLYELPTLDEVEWRLDAGDRPTASIVGFAPDDDVVYTLNTDGELLGLDLTTGRARPVADHVRLAALGPAGSPILVHDDGGVSHIEFRRVVRWSTSFSGPPSHVWGAMRDRAIGIVPNDSSRTLELLADGQQPVRQPLPDGDVSVAHWGDLVAVAADSGVVLLDPGDPEGARFVKLSPPPTLVIFSMSAHRFYAFDGGGTVTAFERFTLDRLGELTLPGAPADVRSDPEGRFLLVRPGSGDSIWVVDLVHWSIPATVTGRWDERLPSVAPDGTTLLERDGELVAFSYERLDVVGRAGAPGDDRWLSLAWDPRRRTLELAEATPRPTAGVPEGRRFYVQVSSTMNPEWAEDLASNLRRAGIDASVLPPEGFETRYRVALGPYRSREDAEAIRRTLNMPSWIFVRDTTGTTP